MFHIQPTLLCTIIYPGHQLELKPGGREIQVEVCK